MPKPKKSTSSAKSILATITSKLDEAQEDESISETRYRALLIDVSTEVDARLEELDEIAEDES